MRRKLNVPAVAKNAYAATTSAPARTRPTRERRARAMAAHCAAERRAEVALGAGHGAPSVALARRRARRSEPGQPPGSEHRHRVSSPRAFRPLSLTRLERSCSALALGVKRVL